MYQLWEAEEQAELWRLQNRALTPFERERLDYLETSSKPKVSLLSRIASIFKAEPEGPEPFIARTPEEAHLVVTGVFEDPRNRK